MVHRPKFRHGHVDMPVGLTTSQVGPPGFARIAAGRPGKGEKRKGNNGSEPNVNCVTRRVRFVFCAPVKNRALSREVSKKKSGSSLARVCGDWRREGAPNPEGELTAGCLRTCFAACAGSFLECARNPQGHFRSVPLHFRRFGAVCRGYCPSSRVWGVSSRSRVWESP